MREKFSVDVCSEAAENSWKNSIYERNHTVVKYLYWKDSCGSTKDILRYCSKNPFNCQV